MRAFYLVFASVCGFTRRPILFSVPFRSRWILVRWRYTHIRNRIVAKAHSAHWPKQKIQISTI